MAVSIGNSTIQLNSQIVHQQNAKESDAKHEHDLKEDHLLIRCPKLTKSEIEARKAILQKPCLVSPKFQKDLPSFHFPPEQFLQFLTHHKFGRFFHMNYSCSKYGSALVVKDQTQFFRKIQIECPINFSKFENELDLLNETISRNIHETLIVNILKTIIVDFLNANGVFTPKTDSGLLDNLLLIQNYLEFHEIKNAHDQLSQVIINIGQDFQLIVPLAFNSQPITRNSVSSIHSLRIFIFCNRFHCDSSRALLSKKIDIRQSNILSQPIFPKIFLETRGYFLNNDRKVTENARNKFLDRFKEIHCDDEVLRDLSRNFVIDRDENYSSDTTVRTAGLLNWLSFLLDLPKESNPSAYCHAITQAEVKENPLAATVHGKSSEQIAHILNWIHGVLFFEADHNHDIAHVSHKMPQEGTWGLSITRDRVKCFVRLQNPPLAIMQAMAISWEKLEESIKDEQERLQLTQILINLRCTNRTFSPKDKVYVLWKSCLQMASKERNDEETDHLLHTLASKEPLSAHSIDEIYKYISKNPEPKAVSENVKNAIISSLSLVLVNDNPEGIIQSIQRVFFLLEEKKYLQQNVRMRIFNLLIDFYQSNKHKWQDPLFLRPACEFLRTVISWEKKPDTFPEFANQLKKQITDILPVLLKQLHAEENEILVYRCVFTLLSFKPLSEVHEIIPEAIEMLLEHAIKENAKKQPKNKKSFHVQRSQILTVFCAMNPKKDLLIRLEKYRVKEMIYIMRHLNEKDVDQPLQLAQFAFLTFSLLTKTLPSVPFDLEFVKQLIDDLKRTLERLNKIQKTGATLQFQEVDLKQMQCNIASAIDLMLHHPDTRLYVIPLCNLLKSLGWIHEHTIESVAKHSFCYFADMTPASNLSLFQQLMESPTLIGNRKKLLEDTAIDLFVRFEKEKEQAYTLIKTLYTHLHIKKHLDHFTPQGRLQVCKILSNRPEKHFFLKTWKDLPKDLVMSNEDCDFFVNKFSSVKDNPEFFPHYHRLYTHSIENILRYSLQYSETIINTPPSEEIFALFIEYVERLRNYKFEPDHPLSKPFEDYCKESLPYVYWSLFDFAYRIAEKQVGMKSEKHIEKLNNPINKIKGYIDIARDSIAKNMSEHQLQAFENSVAFLCLKSNDLELFNIAGNILLKAKKPLPRLVLLFLIEAMQTDNAKEKRSLAKKVLEKTAKIDFDSIKTDLVTHLMDPKSLHTLAHVNTAYKLTTIFIKFNTAKPLSHIRESEHKLSIFNRDTNFVLLSSISLKYAALQKYKKFNEINELAKKSCDIKKWHENLASILEAFVITAPNVSVDPKRSGTQRLRLLKQMNHVLPLFKEINMIKTLAPALASFQAGINKMVEETQSEFKYADAMSSELQTYIDLGEKEGIFKEYPGSAVSATTAIATLLSTSNDQLKLEKMINNFKMILDFALKDTAAIEKLFSLVNVKMLLLDPKSSAFNQYLAVIDKCFKSRSADPKFIKSITLRLLTEIITFQQLIALHDKSLPPKGQLEATEKFVAGTAKNKDLKPIEKKYKGLTTKQTNTLKDTYKTIQTNTSLLTIKLEDCYTLSNDSFSNLFVRNYNLIERTGNVSPIRYADSIILMYVVDCFYKNFSFDESALIFANQLIENLKSAYKKIIYTEHYAQFEQQIMNYYERWLATHTLT